MSITAVRIAWTKIAPGDRKIFDGYSLHKDGDEAARYLSAVYNDLPGTLRAPFSYPGQGWANQVEALPVIIDDRNTFVREISDQRSVRVFPAAFNMAAKRYDDAATFVPAGEAIVISVPKAPAQLHA